MTKPALTALVVGYKRDRMPPPRQCFIAAAAIFAAAVVVALIAGSVRLPVAPMLVTLAGLGVTAVFAARGVAGYLPAWRARFRASRSRRSIAGSIRRCALPLRGNVRNPALQPDGTLICPVFTAHFASASAALSDPEKRH